MAVAGYVDNNTEKLCSVAARTYRPDATKRLAIWCHHSGGDYLSAWTIANALPHVRAVCEDLGLPLVTPDCGGPKTWGNDTAQTRVGDARTFATTKFGAKNDKVVLIGVSMGGLLALNWARANPGLVAAIALLYPAVDLQWVHDNGAKTDTEAAYGGTTATFNAAVAAHNPTAHQADFAGMPIKMWHSDADTVVGTAQQVAFATGVGIPRVTLPGAAHADLAVVDATQVRDFIGAYV
jgi:alpha-beta hydrolase superfamily lysophospholipase